MTLPSSHGILEVSVELAAGGAEARRADSVAGTVLVGVARAGAADFSAPFAAAGPVVATSAGLVVAVSGRGAPVTKRGRSQAPKAREPATAAPASTNALRLREVRGTWRAPGLTGSVRCRAASGAREATGGGVASSGSGSGSGTAAGAGSDKRGWGTAETVMSNRSGALSWVFGGVGSGVVCAAGCTVGPLRGGSGGGGGGTTTGGDCPPTDAGTGGTGGGTRGGGAIRRAVRATLGARDVFIVGDAVGVGAAGALAGGTVAVGGFATGSLGAGATAVVTSACFCLALKTARGLSGRVMACIAPERLRIGRCGPLASEPNFVPADLGRRCTLTSAGGVRLRSGTFGGGREDLSDMRGACGAEYADNARVTRQQTQSARSGYGAP